MTNVCGSILYFSATEKPHGSTDAVYSFILSFSTPPVMVGCKLLLSLLATVVSVSLADFPSTDHVYVPADQFEPVQIRIAYAGPTGMRVSWNTFSQLPAAPTVTYGFSADKLHQESGPGESVTYPTSLTYNNHVHLTDLAPNKKYYWKPAFSNDTSIFSFTTAKKTEDHSPFKIAVAVDLGLIGPQGLSTTVGKGAANPLQPGEITTMQSLQQNDDWDFLWHRKYISCFFLASFRLPEKPCYCSFPHYLTPW